MLKPFLTILIISISSHSFSQRILFQSDFENLNLTLPDSLPQGWARLDADSNFFGRGKSWAVRDTNQILGGDTIVNRPRAHSGKKSLHISWFSGKGGSYESDDWVWTEPYLIQNDDSLIFWSLLGNIEGISFYVDSLQIWICTSQNPASAIFHLATLKSNLDTTLNSWKEHKFSLSQFAGQTIAIAFRYYLPVQEALWCNIDDMFIGNRKPIGINQSVALVPDKPVLEQNYPNPFNPVTVISYSIPDGYNDEMVVLMLYDELGQTVSTLVNEIQSAGEHRIAFNAGLNGLMLSSGIYFYKLTIGNFSEVKRMILLK